MQAFMSLASRTVDKMIPLCVTLAKKPSAENVSGSRSVNKEAHVPEAHVTEDICPPCPTNVEMNNAVDDMACRDQPCVRDQQYDFEPYVNEDLVAQIIPVAQLDYYVDDGHVQCDKSKDGVTRKKSGKTLGTSSSHPGLIRTNSVDNLKFSDPFVLADTYKKWTVSMFTREDIKESYKNNHYVTSETLEDLHLGKFFMSKQELKQKAVVFAIKNNFEYMVKKSTPDVWYVTCKDPDYDINLKSNWIL